MTGVRLYTCPDLEPLLDKLAEALRTPLSDPMAEEVIVVPSSDMAKFLQRQLGSKLGSNGKPNGIVANVRFVYPRELVNATATHPIGVDDSAWDATRLTWTIASIVATKSPTTLPRAFSASPLAAARRVADLFDRYASHRPEMLVGWAAGHRYDIAAGGVQDWQVDLFRSVCAELGASGAEPRAFTDPAGFAAAVADGPTIERISVFGVDSLSRSARAVLAAFEPTTNVTAYWVYPMGGTTPPSVDVLPRKEHTLDFVSHPLSSRWAASAHESLAVVGGTIERLDPNPRGDSLLHRLQVGIIDDQWPKLPLLDDEDREAALTRGDGTIQVHSCYGLARQAEALRDSLLHLLDADETLRLRDILIVCGDVPAAAPVLNAVFDPERPIGNGVPKLPINVLRDADVRLDEFSEAFFAVLDLATGRCSASQLIDAAALGPVRRMFGFDDDSIELLEAWTEQLGVRYGLTARDRATWNLDISIANGTWRAAVDRLLMGVAVPAEREIEGPAGIVPFDGIGANELVVAGTLVEFLVRLENIVSRLRDDGGNDRDLTVDKWSDVLSTIVDHFLEAGREDTENLVKLRGAIHRMGRDAAKSIDTADLRFSLRDLRMMTSEYFTRGISDYWSIFESITVTGLGGMSHVPHRVIAFLGADESAFAAPRADGDDVLSIEPRVGEPIYSLRGRQYLLDLLMAARSHFVLTCAGSDINSNKDVPLAVPVQELLEFVSTLLVETGAAGSHRVFVGHPRHNFDERTMEPGFVEDGAPFTYDENSKRALETIRQSASVEEPSVDSPTAAPQSLATDSAHQIRDISQVIGLLADPISFYYGEVLNVDIPVLPGDNENANRSTTIKGDGILALTLDGLEQSGEGRRLLEIVKRHDDHSPEDWLDQVVTQWQLVRPLTGLLPPGELGKLALTEIADELKMIINALPSELRTLQGTDVDCLVDFGGSNVSLRVHGVVGTERGSEFARVRYARFNESRLLELWAEVALLTIHRKGEFVKGHVASRASSEAKKSEKFAYATVAMKGDSPTARLASATRAINAIAKLHSIASTRPVAFFPSASHALVDGKLSEANKRLVSSAGFSSAIAWHLDGRSMRDLQGEPADPKDIAILRDDASDDSFSEVELFADHIWKAFAETTAEVTSSSDDDDAGDDEYE